MHRAPAAKLKRDGTWDGSGTTLPLALPGEGEPGCASVRIEDRPSNDMAIWNLTVFGDGLPWAHPCYTGRFRQAA